MGADLTALQQLPDERWLMFWKRCQPRRWQGQRADASGKPFGKGRPIEGWPRLPLRTCLDAICRAASGKTPVQIPAQIPTWKARLDAGIGRLRHLPLGSRLPAQRSLRPLRRGLLFAGAALLLLLQPGADAIAADIATPAMVASDAPTADAPAAHAPASDPRASEALTTSGLIGPHPIPLPVSRPEALTFDAPRLCTLIADAAAAHELPPEFLARLIWQESRFDIAALSPVGAEGVAQFMPGTAALRGLENSWDPRMAIPESARFLADLREQFGNLGLAAAAYNGGPNRVARWLASDGRLPFETVNYVLSITSRPVDWFREPGREDEGKPLEEGMDFAEACGRMPVIATRAMGIDPRKPWGVQIAAGISQGAALRAFDRARSSLSSIIGGAEPVLVRSKLVAGRTAWSARVGADSRGEALALCQRIRGAGTSCVVRQN